MNKERLRQIFSNYIRKFEFINSPACDENYKWRVADRFHDLMNPDHPDFPQRMREACKLSANLIDSGSRYCFSALVKCSETKPEAVRGLFRALFADDGGDLAARQERILTFIENANALTRQLFSTNDMFMNDQRSAMGYLFLYDPDHHYLYKATEAKDMTSCIAFYDDWRSGGAFRLDVFYRMCDLMVEEIRSTPELIKTHESRYVAQDGSPIAGMHPDRNYHILLFDILYGAPEFRYDFYQGISFSTITANARKLHRERIEQAEARRDALALAIRKDNELTEAMAYFQSVITVGLPVCHKGYGAGEIVAIEDTRMIVSFPQRGEVKTLSLTQAFTDGWMTADIDGLAEKSAMYRDIVKSPSKIRDARNRAEREFEEYKEYLD